MYVVNIPGSSESWNEEKEKKMAENYHVSNIELEVLPAVIWAKYVRKETVPIIYWMYCTLSVFKNKQKFSYLVFHHVISGVKKEICVHSIWRAGQACQLSPWDPSPWGAVWKASQPLVANFPSWGAQRKRYWCLGMSQVLHTTLAGEGSHQESQTGLIWFGMALLSVFH